MVNWKDEEIIASILEGNTQAFRFIVERYESRVATVIRNMLGNTVEVDDVGQEVFVRLYKSLSKFKGDSKLSTYITRIAVNLSLNEIKKRKRKRFFSFSKSDGTEWDQPDPKSDIRDYDTKELVNRGIRMLKPDYRTVVVLRMIEGYSVKETAEMLGIPSGTVLSRQARGTEQLKNILKTKLSYRHGE